MKVSFSFIDEISWEKAFKWKICRNEVRSLDYTFARFQFDFYVHRIADGIHTVFI